MIPDSLRAVGLCDWCHAPYQPIGAACPRCLYPYHNIEYLRTFDDIKAFHFHAPVGLQWIQDYQNQLGELVPCVHCGGRAFFSVRSEYIHEQREFKDICEISCTGGCTNKTPWLFLYDFEQYKSFLLISWNKGISRLPLVRYSDLKQPSFASGLPPVYRRTKYSRGLYKVAKPAQNRAATSYQTPTVSKSMDKIQSVRGLLS